MFRKREATALAVVLALVALAFADVAVLGKSFYVRDIIRGFYPAFACLRNVVRAGEFPYWNPYFSSGQPLAANPAYAAIYPPVWLAIPFDGFHALALVGVLHYLIAAAGMFFLLRSLNLHPAAAAFGAISFALGGVVVSLNCLLTVLYAVSWMPWLALFTRRFVRTRRPSDFALAALFLGLILLTGEQSMILQCGALVGAYAIYRTRSARALLPAAAICAIALLVGLVQIVPALDHQRDSGRAVPLAYADVTTWSMLPARPLELINANLFGHFTPELSYYWASDHPSRLPWLFSIYAGLLAAALIVAGMARRIRGWGFAGTVSLVSYLFAIGRNGPFIPLLYRLGLGSLRYPEKFFISAMFLLTVFAAIAANEFLRDAQFRRVTFVTSIVFVVFAAGAFAFAASPAFLGVWGMNTLHIEQLTAESQAGALTSLVTAIGLVLILALRERVRLCIGLLALFVAADLGSRVRSLAPRLDSSFYTPPPLARALTALPQPVRIYNDAAWQLLLRTPPLAQGARALRVRNALLPETQALWGIESALEVDVTGTNLLPSVNFASLFLSAQRSGRRDLPQRLLSFAGATHAVVLRDARSPDDPARLLRFPGNRYYFADQLLPANRIMDPLASNHAAFVDRPLFAPAPGHVLRASEHGGSVDLDVETAGDAALIISITRHKYWRAAIDGKPASLYAANVAFQGLTVPLGRHHVLLRYRNPLIAICGVISILTTAALLVIAVAGGLRNTGSP